MSKRSTKQRTQPEPTFAGLAALLPDLADEIELGDTARLRPLVEQVRTLAVELGPIEKSRRMRFSTGTVVTVKKRRSDTKVAEVYGANGSRTISAQGPGPDQLRTDDRTVSDLNEVTKLCFGIQSGRPDPRVDVKLRKLAQRFREPAGKERAADEASDGSAAQQVEAQAPEGDWSKPMPKKVLMSRLGLNSRAFETFAKQHPLKKISRQQWMIRLDKMDARTRGRIETGK